MGRFDFLASEKSRRLARAATDELGTEIERLNRREAYGTLTVRVVFKAGEPAEYTVTPEVTVRADNLSGVDE